MYSWPLLTLSFLAPCHLEQQIDLLVYHFYGLTYDEVLIVDPDTPITKEEYGTLGTGQRFTPKKRTVPMSCFESGIDHIVYQLYGLTDEEIRIVEGKN